MDLEFLTCLSYSEKTERRGLLANEPSLPIQIRGPVGTLDTQLILDTGAERTILSGIFASFVGLELTTGLEVPLQSATGGFNAHLHTVTLSLDLDPSTLPEEVGNDFLQVEFPVAFTQNPIPRSVLGRDFLRRFLIAFDELQGIIYLGRAGQSPVAG